MPTVLIVDDDKHTRALLERLFATDARILKHRIKVVQAGDGVEGLELFESEKPDIVITDLLMPRMDGFRFCKELRARAAKVALLVLSGVYRDAGIASRLRDEFGASYYAKPYQIKDLVTALDRQLARIGRPSTGEPVASPEPVNEPQRGAFAEAPLPRVLLDLHESRATGSLEIRRGRIEKRIDLVVGHPIGVTSNQRAEMLGHFLVLRGAITEKILQEALERAHDEDKKLGETLLALGHLTSADLLKQLTAQARFKITRALRWPDGTWEYRPNRDLLDATKGNALDPVAVVFLGLRKSATLEAAARAVQPLSGRLVALSPRGLKVRQAIARIFGAPLSEALSRTPPFESFLRRPFEPATTLPALEALLVTGCVVPAGPASRAEELEFSVEPPSIEELSGPLRLPLPPEPDARAAMAPPPPTFPDESSDSDAPYEPAEHEVVTFVDEEAVPEEVAPADSGLVAIDALDPIITITGGPEVEALREELLREYLRIQGADLYDVLEVHAGCEIDAVDAGFDAHIEAFALEKYEKFDVGRDYAKLEEIHAAYRHAHETLSSPERRAVHDRERGTKERAGDRSMSAELSFRTGEKHLGAAQAASAVEAFRAAVEAAPDVADYQAALGWALHQTRQPGGRRHVEQALAIDPDHGAAHEYLGHVLAAAGDDTGAAPHLERALDVQPPRMGALDALEELRSRRREAPLLERRYRTLLGRLQPGETGLALRIWLAMARLYLDVLRDRGAARTAFLCASRLAPGDPTILDALAELAEGSFAERADILRARWRLDPTSGGPGLALFRASVAASEPDAGYLASAALAARGQATGDAASFHQQHRPRFLVRAMRPIDDEVLARIRHGEDDADLGAIFAELEPAAFQLAPMTAADLGVEPGDLVDELPEPFARVHDYVAHVLGVRAVPVARRPDFANEAHIGALDAPLLLVGPETLACTDRVELGFRLARAMSYLWPGRGFAGSRPARRLKELFLAAVLLGNPATALEASSGLAAAVRAVATLPEDTRDDLAVRAARIAGARSSVNLSTWAQSLARTADRIGLLLCGDVAKAASAARQMGGDAAAAGLIDWSTGAEHRSARRMIGVSIDV